MSAKITANLLTQRKFAPLLVAQALGAFNDNIIKFSLMILTGYGLLKFGSIPDRYMVPLAANTFVIPIFLFSAMAGQMADKWDRAHIMRLAKFGEIFLMMIAAAGFILQSAPVLFITLFLMGTQSALFAPARLASMPYFLNDDELVPGNALVSGNIFLFTLAGSLVGTLSMVTQTSDGFQFSPTGPLIVGGILIGCAVIGWLAIRFLPSSPPGNPELKLDWNFLWQTWRLLRFVFKKPKILRPIMGVAWFYAMGGAFLAVLPTFVKDVLLLDNSVVAVFITLFSVGAAFGSILCGAMSTKENAINWSITGLCLVVLFSGAIWYLSLARPDPGYTDALSFMSDSVNWSLMLAMFGASVTSGMFVVPLQALAQRRAEVEVRARTLAGSALMNAGAAIIGQFALVYTGLAGLSIQSAFMGIALISLIGSAYMLQGRLRGTF